MICLFCYRFIAIRMDIDMKINKEDPADYLEALLDDMLMDLEK